MISSLKKSAVSEEYLKFQRWEFFFLTTLFLIFFFYICKCNVNFKHFLKHHFIKIFAQKKYSSRAYLRFVVTWTQIQPVGSASAFVIVFFVML